jgi:hypothetical protein
VTPAARCAAISARSSARISDAILEVFIMLSH